MLLESDQDARIGSKTGLGWQSESLSHTVDRVTSSGRRNKTISLVPEHEPWASPPLDFSKKGHLTSNPDDYDPVKIIRRLERNKLVHGNFDVHLVSQACRNQFQEIIDKQLDKSDIQYVNVRKKFKEKAPSVIEKIKM